MTKEEYERLLQSDYWKGYSYSLIKERNFTCQDCGRSFPNERNKLQVHHLVYRDINPWSYSPEEVVVLCKECHQRRHGIIPVTDSKELKTPETNSYTRSYSSEYNTLERDVRPDTRRRSDYYPQKRSSFRKFLISACFLAAILFFAIPHGKKAADNELSSESTKIEVSPEKKKTRTAVPVVEKQQAKTTRKASVPEKPAQEDGVAMASSDELVKSITDEAVEENEVISHTQPASTESSDQLSTAGKDDESFRESIVKQAKQAGVSADGTTMELLDRINHANVVKQAERAGVSTEGTTSEILERINKKNLEKYGQ